MTIIQAKILILIKDYTHKLKKRRMNGDYIGGYHVINHHTDRSSRSR